MARGIGKTLSPSCFPAASINAADGCASKGARGKGFRFGSGVQAPDDLLDLVIIGFEIVLGNRPVGAHSVQRAGAEVPGPQARAACGESSERVTANIAASVVRRMTADRATRTPRSIPLWADCFATGARGYGLTLSVC